MADDTNFNRIMAGLGEVVDIVEGRAAPARVYVPEEVDVRSIRQKLNMSQAGFAARFGFGVAAVRDWEQKRRRPEAAARVLLTVIDRAPDAVTRALEAAEASTSPESRAFDARPQKTRRGAPAKPAAIQPAKADAKAVQRKKTQPSAPPRKLRGWDAQGNPIY